MTVMAILGYVSAQEPKQEKPRLKYIDPETPCFKKNNR
jgi:hypothetical protein